MARFQVPSYQRIPSPAAGRVGFIRQPLLAALFAVCMAGAAAADDPVRSGIDVGNFDEGTPAAKDFFLHVNGKWLEKTEIPADKSDYGAFTVLVEDAQKVLRSIIEEAAAKENKQPGSDEQKVGDFFKSYMDTKRLEQVGVEPIKPWLEKINAVESKEELVTLLGELPRYSVYGGFGCFVNIDAKKSDQYILYVTQAGTTLPDRDYYLKDDEKSKEIRAAFQKYIEDIVRAAGVKRPKRIARRVMGLETQIATAHWTRLENRDPQKTYNKMSADELDKMLTNIDWTSYARAAGFEDAEQFIVRQPTYFEKFDKMFGDVALDRWKDLLTFHMIDTVAPILNAEMDSLHFKFHQGVLRGVKEPSPRWKRGVENLNGILGELVGKIYVREKFKPEAKAQMEELVANLRKALKMRIENLEWMSDATKKRAVMKLAKINTKIGYPDEWRDYSKLEIQGDDLFGNYTRAGIFEYNRMLDKLGKPIDRNEWGMNPQRVNAYYNPLMNEIVFPAAILQPPFFNMAADDAVNYGAIGAVIGHELSHGFDDKGSKYDGKGNLRQWWTQQDRSEFERRADVLVGQYNQFEPVEGNSVNGKLTLGENIGDLGGLSVAYEAYRLSLNGKQAPVIDGLTGDQRFFLGWAQIWRRLYREPELLRRLVVDPHSPSEYRVNGIVRNMDAWYEAFGIQDGDGLYLKPEDRVRIW